MTVDLRQLVALADDTIEEYGRITKPVSIEVGTLAQLVDGCESYVALRAMVVNLAIMARDGNPYLYQSVQDLSAAEVAKAWNESDDARTYPRDAAHDPHDDEAEFCWCCGKRLV